MGDLTQAVGYDLAGYEPPKQYHYEIRRFVKYGHDNGLSIAEAIEPYLAQFARAATYSKHLIAIRRFVDDAVDLLDASDSEKRRIEKHVGRFRWKKTVPGNTEDRVPTPDEVQTLIKEADQTISRISG